MVRHRRLGGGVSGSIDCQQFIEPYDMRLGTNHRTTPPLHQWAAGLCAQLRVELAQIENVTLIALAGEQCRTILRDSPWHYEVPMKGLGIGQQLAG